MFADEFCTERDVGSFDGVKRFFETGAPIWKVTALPDDYVVLQGGEPFGFVTDLVFDDDGQLISVVAVHATRALGQRRVYGFPWDGRGFAPGLDHNTQEIARPPTIDYAEFDRRPLGRTTRRAAALTVAPPSSAERKLRDERVAKVDSAAMRRVTT
jgi:hypothetical protein